MCFREKVICIGICLYILAQAIIHTSFCLWGVNYMKCNFKPKDNKGIGFYVYMTYFLNSTCMKPTLRGLIPKDFSYRLYQSIFRWSAVTGLEFPEFSPNRAGTFTIFKSYLALNVLLMLTTLALLMVLHFNIRSQYVFFGYVPWLVIMGVTIVYDMYVVMWFASHIADTYGIMRWYRHMTGKDHPAVMSEVDTVYPRIMTAWASIFMTLVFSRFIIFWYINVFVFMFVLQMFLAIRIQKTICTTPNVETDSDGEGDSISTSKRNRSKISISKKSTSKISVSKKNASKSKSKLQDDNESNMQTEDESNMQIEDESNLQTEDESNLQTEDESNLQTEDESNLHTEDDSKDVKDNADEVEARGKQSVTFCNSSEIESIYETEDITDNVEKKRKTKKK